MKCLNCKNENPKKVFISGVDFETGKMIGCDKCIEKLREKHGKMKIGKTEKVKRTKRTKRRKNK